MPARTDHDRRDAQSAARNEIATYVQAYIRRMVERAYTEIEQEASTNDSSGPIDWITVGKAAAYRSLDAHGVVLPDHAVALIAATLSAVEHPAIEPART